MRVGKSCWSVAVAALAAQGVLAQADKPLDFGGKGTGEGTFWVVKDITFDGKDELHVLDGLRFDEKTKAREGNALVQVFDNEGRFLRQFSVMDPALGENNMPEKVVVADNGNVFVSQSMSGEILRYTPAGELAGRAAFPGAHAIASTRRTGRDWVAAVARQGRYRDGAQEGGAPEVVMMDAATGGIVSRAALSPPVANCVHLAVDSQGNFYMITDDSRQIFKYSPQGKLLLTLGTGRATWHDGGDGTMLLHTVALDSKGNIYSMAPGNPGLLTVFDPGITTVRQYGGEFKWADTWSVHSSFTPVAIDGKDRVWIASVDDAFREHPLYHTMRPRPAIVRAGADVLAPGARGVVEAPAFGLGFKASVKTELPYDISYEPGRPVTLRFTVAPNLRRVNGAQVKYQVFDVLKNPLAKGRFDVPLADGEEAVGRFSFTPPKFGWYIVVCEASHKGVVLQNVTRSLGVTPRFANMRELAEGESPGGWEDAPRQAFCGLPIMRLATGHEKDRHDAFEANVELALKYPEINVFGFFTDAADAEPANVRAVVERFKDRVRRWEIVNEPNLTVGDPAKYVEIVRAAAAVIKEVDPDAKVMGPDTCGVDIGWNRRFLELGGGGLVDIYTIHDYEGHESVDPVHWRWKIGELRKIMEEHGAGDKPLWQTERAISGQRGGAFLPWCQAIRVMTHRDICEILGIPNRNNSHFYLNDGGFSGCQSFIWSGTGPHPAALATRTREARTVGKTFAGELDFGPTGNKLFMGLRFAGPDADTYIARNLGTADTPAVFALSGANAVTVADWAGNPLRFPVTRGTLTLPLSQMPLYINVPKGGALAPAKVDFGKNIASDAVFTYSVDEPGLNLASLNNGIMEVIHAGHPHGDTGNPPFFRGALATLPQTLEIAFAEPREVSKMIVFGARADNAFTALLDFDVEYQDGRGRWQKIHEVRTPHPPGERGDTPYATTVSWIDDTNLHAAVFKGPVKASRFRLAILRVSQGFLSDDDIAREGCLKAWGGIPGDPRQLCLREIEIYGN